MSPFFTESTEASFKRNSITLAYTTPVVALEGQESFVLSSFAVADCLIYLPEESENIKAGELVEVHMLPGLI